MAKRFMSLGAVVALAMSLGFVASTSAGASGPKPPKGKESCTTMSGSVNGGTVTIGGCTGTANTGPNSMPISITALAGGGTFTWSTSKTTTTGSPTVTAVSAKKCPGYVKGASSEPSADKFSGSVVSDTSGMKVPGKYSGFLCIKNDTAGTFSALKPFKIS